MQQNKIHKNENEEPVKWKVSGEPVQKQICEDGTIHAYPGEVDGVMRIRRMLKSSLTDSLW